MLGEYSDWKECYQEVRGALLDVVHGDITVKIQRDGDSLSTSRRLSSQGPGLLLSSSLHTFELGPDFIYTRSI